MERARQIAAFWPWLPTFRAVAEVEHLGQAAESLGISSSAVSRTISLLEDQLGVELLEREGRGLRLTDAGRLLQTAVRDAMRTVHEASERFEGSSLHGKLRVASVSPASEKHLHPSLRQFQQAYPGLHVALTKVPVRKVRSALLQGRIDVALLRTEVKPDGISVRRLSSERPRVYAPASLDVVERRRVAFSSLRELPFVAMTDTDGDDPYPLSEERNVVFSAQTFDEAMDAAVALGALVVLPESFVKGQRRRSGLREVRTPALRLMHLCAAWRTPLGLKTAADRLVESIL